MTNLGNTLGNNDVEIEEHIGKLIDSGLKKSQQELLDFTAQLNLIHLNVVDREVFLSRMNDKAYKGHPVVMFDASWQGYETNLSSAKYVAESASEIADYEEGQEARKFPKPIFYSRIRKNTSKKSHEGLSDEFWLTPERWVSESVKEIAMYENGQTVKALPKLISYRKNKGAFLNNHVNNASPKKEVYTCHPESLSDELWLLNDSKYVMGLEVIAYEEGMEERSSPRLIVYQRNRK